MLDKFNAILQGNYAPGIYKLTTDVNLEELSLLSQAQGWQLFCIDGKQVINKDSFFRAAAEAMNFPEYFGYNWDAFYDCITDLNSESTAKGYLLVYSYPENFSQQDATEWSIVMEIFAAAVEYWQNTNTRMYILLQTTSEILSGLEVL